MFRNSLRVVSILFGVILFVAIFAAGSGSFAQETSVPSKSGKPAAQVALQRGQQALETGDLGRARTEFEKAVRLAPSDAEALSALGWVLAQQGDADAAVSRLRAAVKIKPGLVEARLTLASVLSQLGKAAEGDRKRAPPEDCAGERGSSSHAREEF